MELKITNLELPKKVTFNYEEMKQELEEKVGYYNNLVYTDEEIKQAKADKALYKANKYKARAEKRANVAAQTEAARKKAVYKAEKWSKKMRKYIGETKVSELNSEQLRLAKKYLGM